MQTTGTAKTDHSFHIWHYRPRTKDFKCVLCGGVAKKVPADAYSGLADRYEKLTDEERALAPFKKAAKA